MISGLDNTFAALADPTRRAILARLAEGDASVGELAAPFSISAPAISRHLKVLENARLIARRAERQQRICRLDPVGLRAAAEWVERYRRFWEDAFDAVDVYLKETASQEWAEESSDETE